MTGYWSLLDHCDMGRYSRYVQYPLEIKIENLAISILKDERQALSSWRGLAKDVWEAGWPAACVGVGMLTGGGVALLGVHLPAGITVGLAFAGMLGASYVGARLITNSVSNNQPEKGRTNDLVKARVIKALDRSDKPTRKAIVLALGVDVPTGDNGMVDQRRFPSRALGGLGERLAAVSLSLGNKGGRPLKNSTYSELWETLEESDFGQMRGGITPPDGETKKMRANLIMWTPEQHSKLVQEFTPPKEASADSAPDKAPANKAMAASNVLKRGLSFGSSESLKIKSPLRAGSGFSD